MIKECEMENVVTGCARTIAALSLVVVQATHGQPVPNISNDITAVRVAGDLDRPVFATAPNGDRNRLFAIEQHTGLIKILHLDTQEIITTPFLDIDGLATGNEQGLLGLAFHPDYDTNGFFYVNLSLSGGDTVIRRYEVSATNPNLANPDSAMTLMFYGQPFGNHNGGWLGFGPNDGYLYISSGDGGSGGDPGNRAQDITAQALGKILRIDVDGDDFPDNPDRNYAIPPDNPFIGTAGDDEIWAYGLRNPWRPSFDRNTGDLYIADVGQGNWEEINYQPADSTGGENYGWKVMEGNHCFNDTVGGNPPCFDNSFTAPIHEYGHTGAPDGGFSITGGYVYRGPIESLQGTYFFADFISEQIWSFRYDGITPNEFTNRTLQLRPEDETAINAISSFGEDVNGNLYILDLGGEVFKIVNRAKLALHAGLNLVSFPLAPDPPLDSAELLARLDSSGLSISRLDRITQRLQTTQFVDGVAQGEIFQVVSGEGYFVTMLQASELDRTGTPTQSTIMPQSGVNLVGFATPSPALDAFQLLRNMSVNAVASIQHFNRETERFDTAANHNGEPVGNNFPIVEGEGYVMFVNP